MFAGRRFGKTYCGRAKADIYLRAAKKNMVKYAAPTQTAAKRIFWREFRESLPERIIMHESLSYPMSLTLCNGSELSLHGGKVASHRGEGFHYVILDEYQDHDPELWDIIKPSLAQNHGGALIMGTPKGRANHAYDIAIDETFSHHNYTTLQGGLVDEEEIEAARKTMDIRTFRQEFEATFEDSIGLVYYAFSDNNRTSITFDPSKDIYLTWDFNVGMRPMSCIAVQQSGEIDYAVKEFINMNSNTRATCENVKEFIDANNFNQSVYVTGDYAGGTRSSNASRTDYDIIDSYFKNYKSYARRTKKVRHIQDRVNTVNSRLCSADGSRYLYVNYEQCPKTREDLLRVEYKEDGRQLDDRNPDRTHPSDALSYYTYNYRPNYNEQHVR